MRVAGNVEFDDATALPEVGLDHSAPLEGVVVCCTSVPDEKRTALAAYAEQMGALHQLDLTRDVTHLIVGAVDTPKYKYVSKNRPDIMPMAIEWIEAIRDLWIADEEIDFKAMERKYLLPTFFSLRFSMTGCDEPTERFRIAELVRAHGATYEGDLTKSITHLISFRTEGAKYKAAKSWGLKIISSEWLHQSIERGMILDEKLFDPSLPVEERGKGAWDRTAALKSSLGRRSRTDSTANVESKKRKLRKAANTKLSKQHDRIWADISGGNTALQVYHSGNWEKTTEEEEAPPDAGDRRQIESQISNVEPVAEHVPYQKTGIFAFCKFWIHEFSATKIEILRNHLESNDGEIIDKVEGRIEPPRIDLRESILIRLFFIVPHDLPKSRFPDLPYSSPPIEIITFWWVERCLHHKKFIDPKDHVIGRPFPVFPIPEIVAQKTVICSSAYTGIDLLHLTRAVELIGATYSDFMTPNSTLLLTRSSDAVRKDKLNFAREWKIPIVSTKWLWDSIEAGTYLPTDIYLCSKIKNKDPLPSHRERSRVADFRSESLPKAPSQPTTRANSRSSSTESAPFFNRDTFSSEVSLMEQQNTNIPTKLVSTVPSQQDEPIEDGKKSSVYSNSAAQATSGSVFTRPSEEITNAISSLLAKSRNTNIHTSLETTEPRKRARILGRVTSNTSNQSCATSVDSTATHGNPVQWPSLSLDQTANERIEMLMKGNPAHGVGVTGSQISSTQLEYNDPDSTVARELVMARMRGDFIDLEKVRKFERKLTIGDIDEPRATVLRNRRGER